MEFPPPKFSSVSLLNGNFNRGPSSPLITNVIRMCSLTRAKAQLWSTTGGFFRIWSLLLPSVSALAGTSKKISSLSVRPSSSLKNRASSPPQNISPRDPNSPVWSHLLHGSIFHHFVPMFICFMDWPEFVQACVIFFWPALYVQSKCSLILQNWTIHGLYWGSYKIHQPAVLEDSLKELLAWLARGLITINISHTFSLSEVRNNLIIFCLSKVLCLSKTNSDFLTALLLSFFKIKKSILIKIKKHKTGQYMF